MLVLARKQGQQIKINDDITITVVKWNGERVWLGIEAPADVSVHRDEVYQKILKEREAS